MTTYGTLTITKGTETIEEWTCEDEARMAYERLCSSGECDEVALVELEGAGPFLASDGDEIAPTHAPRRTIEEWTCEDDSGECKGHPAGPYDPMGQTVYCDGSCARSDTRKGGAGRFCG